MGVVRSVMAVVLMKQNLEQQLQEEINGLLEMCNQKNLHILFYNNIGQNLAEAYIESNQTIEWISTIIYLIVRHVDNLQANEKFIRGFIQHLPQKKRT